MTLSNEMMAFVTSDVSDAACGMLVGRVQGFLSNSLAHFAIGTVLAVLHFNLRVSLRFIAAVVGLVVIKEIFFDIPGSGFAPVVVVDSLWDLLCYWLGAVLVWWAIMGGPGPDAASGGAS